MKPDPDIPLHRQLTQLRRTLEDDPGDALALEQLKALYRKHDAWFPYVELCRSQLKHTADPTDQIALWLHIAQLLEDRLNLSVEAVASYQAILKLDPLHQASLDHLARLYTSMQRFHELSLLLERQARATPEVEAGIAIWLQIARLHTERLNNPTGAIVAFRAIVELDPHHAEAVRSLEQLYLRRRDWRELVDLHVRRAQTQQDPVRRIRLLREAARLASSRIRRRQLTLPLWQHLLELTPDDPEALDAIEDLLAREREQTSWVQTASHLLRVLHRIPLPSPRHIRLLEHLEGRLLERLDHKGNLRLDPPSARPRDPV